MRRLLTVALSVFFLLLAGCGSIEPTKGEAFQFYYCVSSDRHFGPAIQAETDYIEQPSVSSLMSRLLKGPTDPNLTVVIPEGTVLQNWTLRNGELKLDLSEAFGRLTGISLTRGEYCIVLTMAQLEGVDTVSITVDGQSLPGSGTRAMSADDIILRGETEDPITISTQLYYPLSDASGLGVEYREIQVSSTDAVDQANAILSELAKGPTEEEMNGFLSGMGTLSVLEIVDKVCVVEIDSATLECICNPEEQFTLNLYAIVDSLTELGTIEQVSFQLDGGAIEGWQDQYSAQYEF